MDVFLHMKEIRVLEDALEEKCVELGKLKVEISGSQIGRARKSNVRKEIKRIEAEIPQLEQMAKIKCEKLVRKRK
jgi:hypothetical protein